MKGRRHKADQRFIARLNARRDKGGLWCDHCGNMTYPYQETWRYCPQRLCTVAFCPYCRRLAWSAGPVGCPSCDSGRMGHGTWAEFPAPSPPRKYRDVWPRRRLTTE